MTNVAGIFFTRLFTASVSGSHQASRREIHISGEMPTCMTHPGIVPCTSSAPASRRRATFYNHSGISSIFSKTLASCHLSHKQLGDPPHYIYQYYSIGILPQLSFFQKRPAALPLSRPRALPITTTPSKTVVLCSSPTSTLTSEHTLLCCDMAQPSHWSYCVFAAYAHLCHWMPHLHSLFSIFHPSRSRSSCRLYDWDSRTKNLRNDEKRHTDNARTKRSCTTTNCKHHFKTITCTTPCLRRRFTYLMWW